MQTTSTKEIEFEMARLAPLAEAERAFRAANPHDESPWDGSSARLESLRKERDALILATKGEVLTAKLAEKREIEQRIEAAKQERERADKHCAQLAADPTVARFLNGGAEARRRGWGYTWAADFTPWFLSGNGRHAGMTAEAGFFMDAQRCPPSLLFTEADREKVCAHNEARGQAILALTILDGETSQFAALTRQFPELAGVA